MAKGRTPAAIPKTAEPGQRRFRARPARGPRLPAGDDGPDDHDPGEPFPPRLVPTAYHRAAPPRGRRVLCAPRVAGDRHRFGCHDVPPVERDPEGERGPSEARRQLGDHEPYAGTDSAHGHRAVERSVDPHVREETLGAEAVRGLGAPAGVCRGAKLHHRLERRRAVGQVDVRSERHPALARDREPGHDAALSIDHRQRTADVELSRAGLIVEQSR